MRFKFKCNVVIKIYYIILNFKINWKRNQFWRSEVTDNNKISNNDNTISLLALAYYSKENKINWGEKLIKNSTIWK